MSAKPGIERTVSGEPLIALGVVEKPASKGPPSAPSFDSVVQLIAASGRMGENVGAPGDEDYRGLTKDVGNAVLMSPAEKRVRDQYDPERAERIATEYSEGSASLREIHESDPMAIPPPLVIRRWRREWPEFDAMMVDAKRVKAESMMEETLAISGEGDYNVAKNKMQARQKLAAAYDRDTFGETQTLLGDKNRPLMVGASPAAGISDDDLARVALRGRPVAAVVVDASVRGTQPASLPAALTAPEEPVKNG